MDFEVELKNSIKFSLWFHEKGTSIVIRRRLKVPHSVANLRNWVNRGVREVVEGYRCEPRRDGISHGLGRRADDVPTRSAPGRVSFGAVSLDEEEACVATGAQALEPPLWPRVLPCGGVDSEQAVCCADYRSQADHEQQPHDDEAARHG